MFATPAFAQTAGAAGADGGLMAALPQLGMFLMIGVLFYMLILRPQQQRQRDHLKSVKAVKRGDTVVLSNGMIGKVVRVEDEEIGVEVAQGVTVKVIKDMVHMVRARGAPAPANDAKS
jgi:preprotein translocase subunit YajC